MKQIYLNQVGFTKTGSKKAVLNFPAERFELVSTGGETVYSGNVTEFGRDKISGEETFVADFSQFSDEGSFAVRAGDTSSATFKISDDVYGTLFKDLLKCFYYLRCGDALSKEFAGEFYHEPCHTSLATVYGTDEKRDVSGGWHDAGDYGRYSTAGSVAVAHLLYGVRFFKNLLDVDFNIPKENCEKGQYPDILSEVKVELDFLMKMQREDGAVYHKVTTFSHAPFIMPEEDKEELFVFAVSSIATADIAAVCALAYTIYKDYDAAYADKLLAASKKAYAWLSANPNPLLFYNPEGSNTGQYDEAEDFSNRYWAAASLYEATGDEQYLIDARNQKVKAADYGDKHAGFGFQGDYLTCLGWAEVAGLGSFSMLLAGDDSDLTKELRTRYISEADRLVKVAKENGFGIPMLPEDYIWGSNFEVEKYMMILAVTDSFVSPNEEYKKVIRSGLDYLLGCNSMDVSYVTCHGEKAYKNPHLRPTAVDNVDEPWPGLVSGGPNRGLQDEKASELPKDTPPMKCYLDDVTCYSLNEITIYWNSPLVFVLAYFGA
ncbi:glycoside hydrolase [Butyrivibrio sp. CB08]|uniref:glycoside hydrolase family 9 protein n=1 Tax=Butyrivibrio sp. CB08 TaxID=2364879 RepID=UPI000EA877D6|nr:glycoside hydrolase family 9 protein [Butyrivibrio sp. CB08]RKM62056.1 glycoside hydrolase [Butyrivibrio sp. CB08]